ncbi:tRNA1(Val) (adenine(37)-N6)-methyltransferase [Euzebyella saccharophila]|uniref:tRNA1(Val) (adenine(37)-N6)-methyltransferase n=1 Tax=Euzebyella saccharophila TaxID=679664 RepID=A0ABV8JQ88_9FLAO|nr:methyltransferase [Euzebyella saccharophila]
MAETFRFKQFSVEQDRCAMKIGTDGVLLGAWTPLKHQPETILDIGAGTGIISLMLAQRTADMSIFADIEAIELDEDAYEQCVENFENSPWGDRIFCYHAGFDEFVDEIEEPYDLIVSNPPFYSENVTSGDASRDIARQNNSLPFEELLVGVAKLLSTKGRFCCIIPHKEEITFLEMAKDLNLFPKKMTQVKGREGSEFKRTLLELTNAESVPKISELTIEIERHHYTKEYIDLTKDFYLKM